MSLFMYLLVVFRAFVRYFVISSILYLVIR